MNALSLWQWLCLVPILTVPFSTTAFPDADVLTTDEILEHDNRECVERLVRFESVFRHNFSARAPLGSLSEQPGLVRQRAMAGHSISREFLNELQVAPDMHRFYDVKSGIFLYKPDAPEPLAKENGDDPLTSIRIHWAGRDNSGLSRDYLLQLRKLAKLQTDLEILVVTHGHFPNLDAVLAQWPDDLKKRVILTGTTSINHWAQDGSKSLSTGRKVLVPREMGANRLFLSRYLPQLDALVKAKFIEAKVSPFRFEGGNIVVGAQHVFVGSNLVRWAMDDYKISKAEAIAALSAEFGNPVIDLGVGVGGGSSQVDFHIDLHLAVIRDLKTGKEKILLGSVEKAIGLLAPSSLSARPGQIISLFGDSPTLGESQMFRHLTGAEFLNSQKPREASLNALAAYLQSLGYEVERVPDMSFPFDPPSEIPLIFSYTNSIFSKGLALVPEMGIRKWDDYMTRLLNEMGYEVVRFPVAQKSVCFSGGIRCMTETYR